MVRQADGTSADKETILASQIGIRMDHSSSWSQIYSFLTTWTNFCPLVKTDQQIAFVIRRQLMNAFQDFSNDILKACMYEPAAADLPVAVCFFQLEFRLWKKINLFGFMTQFLDPIYGSKNPSYTEFMAPGMILT